MNDNIKQIIETMKPLCATGECYRALAEVAISGGFAYATDGRVGVKIKLTEAVEDSAPEDFPLKRLDESIADAINMAQPSAKITREHNIDSLAQYESNLQRWIADEKKDARRELDDYEELSCPCCGDTVYWDGNQLISEERMKEIKGEIYANIDASNYTCCSRLKIGRKTAYINFRYIKSILELSPEWKIGFCSPYPEPNTYNIWNMVAGTTPDGNAQFVIMGLRGGFYCDLESEAKLTIESEVTE